MRSAAARHNRFASLATFVNRMPYSSDAEHRARGLLQQAIDQAGINDALSNEAVEQVKTSDLDGGALNTLYNDNRPKQGTDFFKPFANQDFELSAAAAAPGYLLQSDVLQALAPYLSVRSDTFRIRTYGEVLDPITGASQGKAWLEAIVQRTPEPVIPATGTPDEPETVNSDLGRRYKIVKVNWLNKDQI
jgi:type II secretory pathway component PulK